jgi:hypothetical protein
MRQLYVLIAYCESEGQEPIAQSLSFSLLELNFVHGSRFHT